MRIGLWVAAILCLFLLQGCFEILEQINLRADGSGDLKLVLNMSKSRSRLNSIMKMKTVNGHDVPSQAEIRKKADEYAAKVRESKGISDVRTELDFTNFIGTLECRFTSVSNLNAALANMIPEKKEKLKSESFRYDATKKELTRLNQWDMKAAYGKMSNADKEIFATAVYTSVFRFESVVESVTNKESKISPSRRAVMLKLNALDVIKNIKPITNTIRLQK